MSHHHDPAASENHCFDMPASNHFGFECGKATIGVYFRNASTVSPGIPSFAREINIASLLIKSCILGFAVAIPVGPASILCMQRALARGKMAGLITGFGVAIVDAIYAAAIALSLEFFLDILFENAFWLSITGFLLMAIFGIAMIILPPRESYQELSEEAILWCFSSAAMITLTNPASILLLLTGFALLGLSEFDFGVYSGAVLFSGIVMGSMLWWMLLTSFVRIFRRQITPVAVMRINRLSGVSIILLGVMLLWNNIR